MCVNRIYCIHKCVHINLNLWDNDGLGRNCKLNNNTHVLFLKWIRAILNFIMTVTKLSETIFVRPSNDKLNSFHIKPHILSSMRVIMFADNSNTKLPYCQVHQHS